MCIRDSGGYGYGGHGYGGHGHGGHGHGGHIQVADLPSPIQSIFRLRLLSKPGLWLILSINTSDDGSLVSHITRVAI